MSPILGAPGVATESEAAPIGGALPQQPMTLEEELELAARGGNPGGMSVGV